MKLIYEVLQLVSKAKTKKDKIAILKEHESWALKDIIRGSMDSNIIWNLPLGAPPYTPSPEHSAPANLHRENMRFKYFVTGGEGDRLPAVKREQIFIGILEGIDPNDAELVVDMINKKPPAGVTRAIVNEAFPGLLKD
jgi:hypothetical protein